MRIELAKHSGFCTGVRTALIKVVSLINTTDEDVFINGPLIHNPQTVEILKKRGLVCLDDQDVIDDRIIAVRTHGVPLEHLKKIRQRSKKVINLTCKKVALVQGIVKKYSSKGYHIIILGDERHAEVLSIKSYALHGATVISTMGDIEQILRKNSYLLVAQTTLDTLFFDEAVKKIKERLPDIKIINTICSATKDRQDDLHVAIKKGVDAIVVVGGKNSANTKRLVEIGREHNITVFHIETETELIPDDFKQVKYVLVTAGASTPSWIINNVLEKLYEIKYAKHLQIFAYVKSFVKFFVRTNIVSALLGSFFTMVIMRCFLRSCSPIPVLLSPVFIFSMYTINNLFQTNLLQLSNPFKYNLYTRFRFLIIGLLAVSLFVYIFYSWQIGGFAGFLYIISFICGTLYALPVNKRLVNKIPFRQVTVLYGAKSFVSSLGWGFVTMYIPYIINPYYIYDFISLFIIILSIIIVRNVLLDLLDYQGDLLLGIETFPTMFGIQLTRVLFYTLSILYIVSIGYSICNNTWYNILFMFNLFYYYWLYKKIKNTRYFYRLKFELLVDLNLILFAVVSVIINVFLV